MYAALIRSLVFALALFPALADAQLSGGMMFPGPGTPASSGSGCSQATTFLARTSGLDSTHQTLYTNLICGMVTDGTGCSSWGGTGNLDLLYILMTQTSATAALNLCSTSFGLTVIGSPTFAADQGYTGAASSALNTNWIASTNGVNFTLNSASWGAYILNNRTASSSNDMLGGNNSGFTDQTFFRLNIDGAGTCGVWFNNSTGTNSISTGVATSKGSWIGTRTSSTSVSLYRNGGATALGTITQASNTLLSVHANLLAGNNNGSVGFPSSDSMAAAFFGGAQTSTSQQLISNRINAFAAGLATPINVY